ncbi:MAG: prepilin-type N-terminal cleavage/methylation domain-containing protein [Vicinamibacteria bacterium]
MRENGHTLVELLVAAAILLAGFAVGLPSLKAASVEAHLTGAADVFKGEFLKARTIATHNGVYTALRFERVGDVHVLSTYVDGNHNGVLAADIKRGVDKRVGEPRPLHSGAPGVRIGILPGLPAPPPERGPLDTSDPIRFGRADMLSFSPLGSATPGTFYLAGEGMQGAVRVNGQTARVRTLIHRHGRWSER